MDYIMEKIVATPLLWYNTLAESLISIKFRTVNNP